VFCRKFKTGGDNRFAGLDRRKFIAGGLKFINPGSIENGSAHTAARQQFRISGIYDCVNIHRCYIAAHNI
jgi:hypothetical protein